MDLRLLFILLFFLLPSISQATGSITHMFIAEETANKLTDSAIKNLIQNNRDAYLVGATYPDTGYIQGTHYGFDSHREAFLDTFLTYLQEKYLYPEQQNPRLVAFLLGCAVHQTVDQVFHGAFMNKIAMEDFHGDWQKTHTISERNLDFLINIEKNQWREHPQIWWVPISDLVAVYHKMGKNTYSASEIFWGNIIYSFNGLDERLFSLTGYFYAQSHTPWLAKHYYATSQGGVLFTEEVASKRVLEIWRHLLKQPEHKTLSIIQPEDTREVLI